MSEISQDQFEDLGCKWLTAMRRVARPKTTGRRLTSLRAFARWAGWGEMFADYRPPTPLRGDPHPIPEGVEGIKRMIAQANNEHQRALVAACGLCGMRIAEALSIKASDFNTQTENITVLIRGKGDKQRRVPVSNLAWEYLKMPVFRSFCNGDTRVIPMQDRNARAIITRLASKAELVRRVASHDLRATFATAVYDKTLDQRLVQELLGHSSGAQTEIYIGRTVNQLRAGVELG